MTSASMSSIDAHRKHVKRRRTHAQALFAWPSPAQVGRWLERSEQVGDCLLWRGPLNRDGYAAVWFQGRKLQLHRIAFAFWRGPIPHGCDVHHVCGNRACWNPDHLESLASRVHRAATWFEAS